MSNDVLFLMATLIFYICSDHFEIAWNNTFNLDLWVKKSAQNEQTEQWLKPSQMPYPVAICLDFLFWKLCYRFVKFPEYHSLVIRQYTGYRYCIGNMV